MNNFATEFVDDEGKLLREVAKFSGRRQGGVALRFKRFKLCLQFLIGGGSEIFGCAKQSGEGAVNGVGGASEIWVNGNANVRTVRPVLPILLVEQISFGLKVADFSERQFDLPTVGRFLHRQIAP